MGETSRTSQAAELPRVPDGADRNNASARLANFLFQRIVGINRDCPWPVHFTSKVQYPERIKMDPSVRASFATSAGCYIQAANGLCIGAGTTFECGVKIISGDHDPLDLSRTRPSEPIRIGRGCRLGANAVVLPGVVLGDRVVVLPGSVVTRSFADGLVVGGVPAKVWETSSESRTEDTATAMTGSR